MVNRVILIGNLGKDPEVRTLENGALVAKFSLATNESYKDKQGAWQQQTEWHDIVVWRSLAERARDTLKKGSMIYVEGKLTHRTWQDKDGNNRRTTEVVANYFRQIGNRRDDTGSSGYFPGSQDELAEQHNSYQESNGPTSGQPSHQQAAVEEADDDLPF